MCDQREKLIGYVYDECEDAERQAVERHLEECHVCRQEIAGLQAVRQDLLAWSVPDHDPVWRPVVPARPKPTWRDVPAWALAAAASFIFLAGAAGGVATRVWLPASTTVAAAVPPSTAMVASQATTDAPALSPEQMSALEARVLAKLEGEMDARVKTAATEAVATVRSNQAGTVHASSSGHSVEELARRIEAIRAWQQEQLAVNVSFNEEFRNMNQNLRATRASTDLVPVSLQRAAGR